MTGWRIGYAAGPEKLIKAMDMLQSQSTSNPSSISQAAAVEALNGPQDFIPRPTWWRSRSRRDLVVDMLNTGPGIFCPKPEGAFYVYPVGAWLHRQDLVQRREDRQRRGFRHRAARRGRGCRRAWRARSSIAGHFRISYALDDATLEDACTRIKRFCEGLK
jgi:aspartate aminotransferase